MIADRRLLFYGEGPARASLRRMTSGQSEVYDAEVEINPYSSNATYYLSDALPRTELPKTSAGQTDETSDRHFCIELIEHEEQNPSLGGAVFHGPALKAGDSETFSFNIENYATDASMPGRIYINAATKVGKRISLPVSAKGVTATTLRNIETTVLNSKTRVYSTANGSGDFTPEAEDGTVEFTLAIPADYTGSYAAVDRAYIVYPRRNSMGGRSELFMNVPGTGSVTLNITDAPAGTVVWDVTDATAARAPETKQQGKNLTVATGATSGTATRLVAFDPAARHRSPVTDRQPQTAGICGAPTPELIIVTSATLRQAAEELAETHRRLQGKKVLVVTQEEVFDEFSYGMRSAPAIRLMVKYFTDRGNGLRHLLLYGPSSYDNRGLTVTGDNLVCYECQASDLVRDNSTNYVSDTYFGILQDVTAEKLTSAPASVAVGRIPAHDEGVARKVNRKIERYLTEAPTAPYRQRMLKFSDDGDGSAHFTNSEKFANVLNEKIEGFTITRADNMLFPWAENGKGEEALRRIGLALSGGQGLVFYSGHGIATSVCNEIDFNVGYADALSNNTLPLFYFSTCDNYPFDRDITNLSHSIVLNGEGGGIGSIGASRTVYLDYNHQLAMAVAEQYAGLKPGQSGADILMNARNSLLKGTSQPGLNSNMLCYNYCGDPAVPLPVSTGTIAIEIPNTDVPTGRAFEVSGSLTDSKFNGTALIEFYDVPKTVKTLRRNKDDGKETDVTLDQMLLAQFPAKVKNGKFKTSVTLPPNNRAQGTGRMVVSAIDNSTGKRAAGEMRGLVYGDMTTLGEPAKGSARIEEFFIDPSYYTDGNNVSPTFRVKARIRPSELGLATGTSTIGNSCRLVLDGQQSYADAMRSLSFDSEGDAVLDCRIGPIGYGRHTLTLSAVDNAGGITESSITFFVGPAATDGRLAVGDEPCRTEALFDLEEAGARSGRLMVTDAEGRTVFSREDCTFPYGWNLAGNDGSPVADGLYRAWVIFPTKKSTPAAEFTVIK